MAYSPTGVEATVVNSKTRLERCVGETASYID